MKRLFQISILSGRKPHLPRMGYLVAAAALSTLLAGCVTTPDGPPAPAPAPEPVSPEMLTVTESAIEKGRYDDARMLLERILVVDPTNVRALLAMSEVQLARNELNRAAKGFSSVKNQEEVAARARQGLGITLLMRGESEQGMEHLREAVSMDPTLWRSWNALASFHDSQGDWENAGQAYEKAVTLRPDEALLYNNRGFSRLLQHRYDEAIADFERALSLQPDLARAQENLRIALAWTGQYKEAMFGISRKDVGRAFNNVGFVAILRGDLQSAESYLLRSMEADASFNKTAHKNLEYLNTLKLVATVDAGAEEQ